MDHGSDLAVPELPEVETMVRGIRPYVQGRKLVALKKCRCRCKPIDVRPGMSRLRTRLVGQTAVDVRRLAKRVVVEFSSGELLVIEPRMTGLMLLSDPPDKEHLRIQWQFSGRSKFDSLWFWDRRGLGTVRLYSSADFTKHLGSHKLGPDALEMTEAEWRSRCAATRRSIKVALLDQKLVAGIGNLYASEILHLAKIHPQQRADRLTKRQLKRLHVAVDEVLREAIRLEGSTLSDATYRNALNRNGQYQDMHRVYSRAGERCGTCRSAVVERIVQSQRSTFFCPNCQRDRSD